MRRLCTASLALCMLLGATGVRAQDDERPKSDINPFRKSYWGVELTRNYPMAFSQQVYLPGNYEPSFTYLHDLDAHWIMGLGAQFKLFERRELEGKERDSQWLALASVTHETLYVARLSHPTYLLIGPKLLYLLPTQTAKLPIVRESKLEMEIGGALTVQLARLIGDRTMLTLRVDRWRGTKTSKLQGLEVAFGAAFSWE